MPVDKLMECLGDSRTKGPAGILFEQAAHYSIRKGLKLTMTSLQGLHSGTVPLVQDVSIPSIPIEKKEKSRYY